MTRWLRSSLNCTATAMVLAYGTSVSAQSAPTSATDITREQIQTVLASMGESIDRQLKIADIGGGENVGVGILHRDGDNDTDGAHRRRPLVHDISAAARAFPDRLGQELCVPVGQVPQAVAV